MTTQTDSVEAPDIFRQVASWVKPTVGVSLSSVFLCYFGASMVTAGTPAAAVGGVVLFSLGLLTLMAAMLLLEKLKGSFAGEERTVTLVFASLDHCHEWLFVTWVVSAMTSICLAVFPTFGSLPARVVLFVLAVVPAVATYLRSKVLVQYLTARYREPTLTVPE